MAKATKKTRKKNKKSKAQSPLPPAPVVIPDYLDFKSPVAGKIALNELVQAYYAGNLKGETLRTIAYVAQTMLGFLKLQHDIEHDEKMLKKLDGIQAFLSELKRN
jgi:hypothetical protein